MIDPLGLRALTQGERDFLRSYFGDCLDLDAIDLKPTRMSEGRQIFRNNIRMPQAAFKPDGELDLSGWVWGSHFAHEALHVRQRQNGRPVTLLALPLQIGKSLHVIDPYKIDGGITDPGAMLQYFERSQVERQAAIFDSGVATHMQNGSAGRFRAVLHRVKNCGC